MKKLKSDDGSLRSVVEGRKNVYVPIELGSNMKFLNEMTLRPFKSNDIAVLNLTTNTATAAKIRDTLSSLNLVEFDLSSKAHLKAALARNAHRKVFVLGHVEGDSFVTVNERNVEIFRLSFEELKAIAAETKTTIYALGCNAAAGGLPGPLEKFNTVFALDQFHQALGAKNYAQFFERLASEDFPLFVDETFKTDTGRVVTIRVVNGPRLAAAGLVATLLVIEGEDENERRRRRMQRAGQPRARGNGQR